MSKPGRLVRDEAILHFSLQDLLPASHVLTVHLRKFLVCELAAIDAMPYLLWQEVLTSTELSVLLPVLEWFPYYCPHEVVFARFTHPAATEQEIERARTQLQEAQETGIWDQTIRPARSAISRTRLKLRPHGLDLVSVVMLGYLLKGGSDGDL